MVQTVDRADTFEKIVLKLNGIVPRVDVLEPVSPLMISRAVHAMFKASKDIRLSSDVWKYIAITLVESGYVLLPKWLTPARKYMIPLEKRAWVRKSLEKMSRLREKPRSLTEKIALAKFNLLLGV